MLGPFGIGEGLGSVFYGVGFATAAAGIKDLLKEILDAAMRGFKSVVCSEHILEDGLVSALRCVKTHGLYLLC